MHKRRQGQSENLHGRVTFLVDRPARLASGCAGWQRNHNIWCADPHSGTGQQAPQGGPGGAVRKVLPPAPRPDGSRGRTGRDMPRRGQTTAPVRRRDKGARRDEDRTQFHQGRRRCLCGHRLPHHRFRDSQSRRDGGLSTRELPGARRLEPGRLGRDRAEVFPQGRRAQGRKAGQGKGRACLSVALCPRRGQRDGRRDERAAGL